MNEDVSPILWTMFETDLFILKEMREVEIVVTTMEFVLSG